MCNLIVLSTTSDRDLTECNTGDLVFDRHLPGMQEEQHLQYKNRWYVGSSQGCSCGFRHLLSENFPSLGFDVPQDWFTESQEDIEATLKWIKVVRAIVASGDRVDCIDIWEHSEEIPAELAGRVDVAFSSVPDEAFRFVENYHHEFLP